MKAFRRLLNELLVLVGSFGLVVIAIPLLVIGGFLLRAAFLFALPVVALAGVALWFSSARFRAWWRAVVGSIETYKGLRLATDVALARGHAWTRQYGDRVTVGADDLLATVIGPVQRVVLPPPGRHVMQGDVLFRLQRGNRAIDVPAPMDGIVVAGNVALTREPGLVNEDPFRRGWAVKLRAPDPQTDPPGLHRGSDARVWFQTEVDRMLAVAQGGLGAMPVMADGGLVSGDIYLHIDDGAWERLTKSLGGAWS